MTPDSGEFPRGLIPRLLYFNDASWCYIQGVNFKTQEFEKVTIYTTGRVLFDCIVRIDARQARLWVAPFAQYKKSVHVQYVPKRGRRVRSFVVPSCYVVVVPITDAIDPDKLFLPPVNGESSPRYYIGDPRWRSDFDEKLCRAKIPILADYRGLFPG